LPGRAANAPRRLEVTTIPQRTAAADIPILHPSGLHARPAAAFVRTAGRFRAAIRVAHAGREADGKSILEVLTLGVHAGSTVHVIAEGEDAREAVSALIDLAGRRFEGDPPPPATD
jgi:phosphotransferase system HPr (HPr) family protein